MAKRKTTPVRRIEFLPLSTIKEATRNPKAHHQDIGTSIGRFGFADAPILDERTGRLVAGHGRRNDLIAKQKAGESPPDGITLNSAGEWLVPVQRGWSSRSDAEAEAFLLAHNRVGEAGGWEPEELTDLLKDLTQQEIDLSGLGWSAEELEGLVAELTPVHGGEDPGAGEPPADPVSRRGEVYELGPHRLMCGDCMEPETWGALLQGKKITVLVTSPPYAQQRKYDETSGFVPIPAADYVDWYEPLALAIKANLTADGSYFLNIKEHCEDGERVLYVKDLTLAHKRRWGFRFVDEYAWAHGGTPKAVVKRFKNGWEPVFMFTVGQDHKFRPDRVTHLTDDVPDWMGQRPNMEDVQQHGCTEGMRRKGVNARKKRTSRNSASLQGTSAGGREINDRVEANTNGMAYPSNVLKVGKNREALGHSAAFSVALPEFFVKVYSDEGDAVADPFMGSGSTLIAAAQQDRVGYGIELSPAYCDVIRRRYGEYARSANLDPGPGAL